MEIYAINTETQSTMTKIVVSPNVPCAVICSTLLYYISLLTWYGNLCNQYRDPINNDKDCRVDQCAMCRDLLLLLLLVSNWLRLRALLEVDICSSQHYYTTIMICITGTLQQHKFKHKYRYQYIYVHVQKEDSIGSACAVSHINASHSEYILYTHTLSYQTRPSVMEVSP